MKKSKQLKVKYLKICHMEISKEILEEIRRDLERKHGEITYMEILDIRKRGEDTVVRVEIRTRDSCLIYDVTLREDKIVHKELMYAIPTL